MKQMMQTLAAVSLALAVAGPVAAGPSEEIEAFQGYFVKKFPNTPKADFINGVYSIDEESRAQWQTIEEFAPYEIDIEKGDKLFHTAFANGKGYADCFPGYKDGIRQNYPHYDKASDSVVTLEGAINQCRTDNGEKALGWKKGDIASISAYLAYLSRGKAINVDLSDPGAQKWYERGKKHFYAKRGQLNLACADCHVNNSGNYIRADLLSPALGHVTHFPVYRSKWGELGTLHRRYGGCNKQVRAKPFKAQSDEYKALELFHTAMSNGMEINGPGARK